MNRRSGFFRRAVRGVAERLVGRYCPLCGSKPRYFRPAGILERSQCPECGSHQRHRLAWIALHQLTPLFDGKPRRILHVAPEDAVAKLLKAIPNANYRSCDLDPQLADEQVDLTAMPFADGSLDFIYCSHVLEHIPDDRKAMQEIRRVLSPQGFALIMVPIFRAITDEDPSVTDPEERTRRFGQFDHVRVYGEDFCDRLRDAGLSLSVLSSEDVRNRLRRWQMALYPRERAFIARPTIQGSS